MGRDFWKVVFKPESSPAYHAKQKLFSALEAELGEQMTIDNIVLAIGGGFGEEFVLELQRIGKEEPLYLSAILPDEVAKAIMDYEKK